MSLSIKTDEELVIAQKVINPSLRATAKQSKHV